MSSVRSRQAAQSRLLYIATRPAQEGLCRAWADAFGGKYPRYAFMAGTTANAVLVGLKITEAVYNDKIPEAVVKGIENDLVRCQGILRFGELEDVADVVGLLCREELRWMTSSVIYADEGAMSILYWLLLRNLEIIPQLQAGSLKFLLLPWHVTVQVRTTFNSVEAKSTTCPYLVNTIEDRVRSTELMLDLLVRGRLASLYSDFRYQRSSNPDGYQANSSAWLRALTSAAKAGLFPAQSGRETSRFRLHTGEELLEALETPEFGRPLALGAVVEDAVRKKDFIQLKEFLEAKKSTYAKRWVPTPWQAMSWGLRQLGLTGEGSEDKLVAGDFVVMANLEAAAKAIAGQAAKIATSNTSRVFTEDLFVSTFSASIGTASLSATDLSILLTHLSRDRSLISYDRSTSTVKFKAPTETQPNPVTAEDIPIANLRSLIASLEPQIEQLTLRISELDTRAREAVTSKQLTIARSALRSKKLADSKLQQRTATLTQLEEVYGKIEQAADQVDIVRVMEASGKTLQSLNAQTGGVERVQNVIDALRDEMTNTEEISQAINEVSAGKVDDAEVDDELEALEKAEREKAEEVERIEREKKEAVEAEETRRRLAELDRVGEEAKKNESVCKSTINDKEADAYSKDETSKLAEALT